MKIKKGEIMGDTAIVVKFKQYYYYDFKKNRDSHSFDLSRGELFKENYFEGNKSFAKVIENKYIYVFQRASNGDARINHELKAGDQGKLVSYDIKNWKSGKERQVKARNLNRILLDEGFIRKGGRYYFALSQIRWSKKRIEEITRQLAAGNCKRLLNLPVHKEYNNGVNEEDVSYDEDYTVTVYLRDYLEAAYKEGPTVKDENGNDKKLFLRPSFIYHYEIRKNQYNDWLMGSDSIESGMAGKKLSRNELKAVNDAIWDLVGSGTKYWDLKRMMYAVGVAVSSSIVPLWPAIKSFWEKLKKHDVYVEKLRVFDEDEYGEVSFETKRHELTEAEVWQVEYERKQFELYDKLEKIAEEFVIWISQAEFIAMQHDYLYSESDDDKALIKDISGTIFKYISTCNIGRLYLDQLVTEIINDLDSIKKRYVDMISSIYSKNIDKVSQDDEFKLLEIVSKDKNETSFWTTSFFVLRKFELGTIKVLEAFSPILPSHGFTFMDFFRYSQHEEVLSKIDEIVKLNLMDTLYEAIPDKRFRRGVVSVPLDSFENEWHYKNKYKDLDTWREIKAQELEKKLKKNKVDGVIDFKIEDDFACIFVKKQGAEVTFDKAMKLDKEKIKISKEIELHDKKMLGTIVDTTLLDTIGDGFEIINVMFAIQEMFDNKSRYESITDVMNLSSAILDLVATVLARKAAAETGKTLTKAALSTTAFALGSISGILEGLVSLRYSKECAKLGDTDAEKAHLVAAIGGFTVAIGSAIAIFTSGGPVAWAIITIGIILQVGGTIVAAIVEQDDNQLWINHSHWGKNNLTASAVKVDMSPILLKDWKYNLAAQLEAYYFIKYGFSTQIKALVETPFGGSSYPYGRLSFIIEPKCLSEKSKIYISLRLDDEKGNQISLIEDKIIALDESMLSERERGFSFDRKRKIVNDRGYVLSDVSRSGNYTRAIMLTWYDPRYPTEEYWFSYEKGLAANNRVEFEVKGEGVNEKGLLDYLSLPYMRLKGEVYIDYTGKGNVFIPTKDKNGEIRKYEINEIIFEAWKRDRE